MYTGYRRSRVDLFVNIPNKAFRRGLNFYLFSRGLALAATRFGINYLANLSRFALARLF
jgi:hypothetical protein